MEQTIQHLMKKYDLSREDAEKFYQDKIANSHKKAVTVRVDPPSMPRAWGGMKPAKPGVMGSAVDQVGGPGTMADAMSRLSAPPQGPSPADHLALLLKLAAAQAAQPVMPQNMAPTANSPGWGSPYIARKANPMVGGY